MSKQVASQTREWPSFQGMTVTPSGRFPSSRQRPLGSRIDGAALRIPIPPALTGSETWVQTMSLLKLMLRTSDNVELSSRSKAVRHEDVRDGDVRRV